MGNDGVHDIDYTRWGLGVKTHPNRIAAVGGKYFFDDQQFPDTQHVLFEYEGDGKPENHKTLIYEQRLWSTNYPRHTDSGAEFYGTEGQMYLSRRGKIEVLGPRNESETSNWELRLKILGSTLGTGLIVSFWEATQCRYRDRPLNIVPMSSR